MFLLYLLGGIGAAMGVAAIGRKMRARHDEPIVDQPSNGSAPIVPSIPGESGDGPMPDRPTPDRGAAREHDVASDAPAGIPSTADWARVLAAGCATAGVQLAYALKWIAMESGGNPCAIGYPPAHGNPSEGGDPAFPLEMGIAQFYNPDDLQRLHLTGGELRAYCMPGDQHETTFHGRIVRGFSQAMSRPITAAEMQKQANGCVELIVRSMASASADLTAVGAGSPWSPTRRDFWALTKLQHGLPALSRQGMPLAKQLLGRAPGSWSEFRDALNNVKFSAAIETKYRKDFPRILDNAWECASAFAEQGVG